MSFDIPVIAKPIRAIIAQTQYCGVHKRSVPIISDLSKLAQASSSIQGFLDLFFYRSIPAIIFIIGVFDVFHRIQLPFCHWFPVFYPDYRRSSDSLLPYLDFITFCLIRYRIVGKVFVKPRKQLRLYPSPASTVI